MVHGRIPPLSGNVGDHRPPVQPPRGGHQVRLRDRPHRLAPIHRMSLHITQDAALVNPHGREHPLRLLSAQLDSGLRVDGRHSPQHVVPVNLWTEVPGPVTQLGAVRRRSDDQTANDRGERAHRHRHALKVRGPHLLRPRNQRSVIRVRVPVNDDLHPPARVQPHVQLEAGLALRVRERAGARVRHPPPPVREPPDLALHPHMLAAHLDHHRGVPTPVQLHERGVVLRRVNEHAHTHCRGETATQLLRAGRLVPRPRVRHREPPPGRHTLRGIITDSAPVLGLVQDRAVLQGAPFRPHGPQHRDGHHSRGRHRRGCQEATLTHSH